MPVRVKTPLETVSGLSDLLLSWNARLAGAGRIVLRYSGTENLARVMVEGTDATLVQTCADELAELVARELGIS